MKELILILLMALGLSITALGDTKDDDAFRLMMFRDRITKTQVSRYNDAKAKRVKLSPSLRGTVVSR